METLDLVAGLDYFTITDILEKAAAHKGLKITENRNCIGIETYILGENLLAVLAERNQFHYDQASGNLADTNSPDRDFWKFPRSQDGLGFNLQVKLSIYLGNDSVNGDVIFVPRTSGMICYPNHPSRHLKLFKALIENDENAPAFAKELAASDRMIVVTWSELGLDGVKTLPQLFFGKFTPNNKTVAQLGRDGKIFYPTPAPEADDPQYYEEKFIVEPTQPKILKAWESQLEEYRSQLKLA